MKRCWRAWRPRIISICCAVAVCLGLLPARAIAVAPIVTEPAWAAPQVLWHDGSTIILLPEAGGEVRCITSRPADLAFGLGYLAGQRDPAGFARVRLAVLGLAGASAPSAPGSRPLPGFARQVAPAATGLKRALAAWPADRLHVLEAVAAGLNQSVPGVAGSVPAWTAADVALLAVQGPVLLRLAEMSPSPMFLAGPFPDPGASPITLGGPAAVAAWGEPLRRSVTEALAGGGTADAFAWVQLLISPAGALEYRMAGAAWLAAAWEAEAPGLWLTDAGPLLWTDEQLSLGLAYRSGDWESRLAALGERLEQALAAEEEDSIRPVD